MLKGLFLFLFFLSTNYSFAQCSFSESHTDISCIGANDGTIDLTPLTGTGPFTFDWLHIVGTDDGASLTGLGPGTYSATMTDNVACTTSSTSITIDEPGTLTITEDSSSPPSCFGSSDGFINLTISGGTGPFNYSWSHLAGSPDPEDLSGLIDGTYDLTVTDSRGCTDTYSNTLIEPSELILTSDFTEPTCNLSTNGTIDLMVAGGTGPFNYSWSNLAGSPDPQDQLAVGSGSYTVTVTDGGACIETHTVLVTAPAAINISETHVDNVCYDDELGSINITVVGGTGAYNYDWDHIPGTNNTANLTALAANVYDITVTDANSCTSATSVNVNEPAELIIGETHEDVSCEGGSDGSIDLEVSGGTGSGTYVYDWDHIPGTDDTDDPVGLDADDYFVTVTDANSCTASATITIEEPLVISIIETHTDVTCFGADDGTIDITASGGNGSNTYDWAHLGGPINSEDLTGLAVGTYDLTVTDVEGCFATVSIEITGPSAVLSITNDNTNESCPGNFDGEIDLTASGGTGPYNYNWAHIGGTNNSADLTSLTAGTYTVTVTDAKSCVEVSTITLENDPIFDVTHTQINVSCNGLEDGSVDLSVSGGTGSLRYDWSHRGGPNNAQDQSGLDAAPYTITITDGVGCSVVYGITITEPSVLTINDSQINVSCNGGNDASINISMFGGTSPYTYDWGHISGSSNPRNLSSLDADTYDLTVTDFNGCTETVSIEITEPDILAVSDTSINVSCFSGSDGSIGLTVTGGTTPYTYDWDMDGTGDFDDIRDPVGLGEGTYAVIIRDANGCTESTVVTITEPLLLEIAESHADVYCNGDNDGDIDITVSGGTAPYTYDWDHIAGTDDAEDLGSLTAGTYSVTVTDSLSCAATITVTIESTININLSDNHTDISCDEGSDGSIDLIISGNGTAPYTFDWDGDGMFDDPQNLTGLPAGTYNVTVRESLVCSQTHTVTLTQPDTLTSTATHTETTCSSLVDGTATVIPVGGTAPYDYDWSTGGTTPTITDLSAGTYTVTVTDALGCVTISSTVIPFIAILDISTSVVSNYLGEDITCVGASDGFALVEVTSGTGTGPFDYIWSNGDGIANLNNVEDDKYYITVTDDRGCIQIDSITLNDPPQIVITIDTTEYAPGTYVSCNGADDGELTASAIGGIGSYSYAWSHTGSTAPIQSGLAPGNYTVTVTDDYGCSEVLTATLSEPLVLSASITTSNFNGYQVSCNGGSDAAVAVSASGGAGGYTYEWSDLSTGTGITGLSAGGVSVTVTDANGCTATNSTTLTEPPVLSFTNLTAAPTDCGTPNGIILINASGGTGVYQYSLDNITYQPLNNFTGLATGTYNVYVRNEFGTCVTGPILAIVDAPDAPAITNTIVVSPSEVGLSDGGIMVTASGNGLAYRYRLDGGAWQTSNVFENLGEGTYLVEVSYVGQTCITSISVNLIAGNGVVGNTGDVSQYCSTELSGSQFLETYFIPWPEDEILTSFLSMNHASCGAPSVASDSIFNYNAIGVTENGTEIVYDHYENDGYETNIAFPVQSSTEYWGDGNPLNGFPPGHPSDILNAGDIIILDNKVHSATRDDVFTDYDGGDKFASRGRLTFSRVAWATGPESQQAGALEVYPKETWGDYFEVPVGEDYRWESAPGGFFSSPTYEDLFEYTGTTIMAGTDGTVVTVDLDGDNITDLTYTLGEGESQLINGGFDVGGSITSSNPVQVHLITGRICGSYETRLFTLQPVADWTNAYFNPVSTENSDATVVHVYNPNPAIAINVTMTTRFGTTTRGVGAGGVADFEIPNNTGSKFSSNDGNFYAVATVDSRNTTQWKDWGFALLPENKLSGQLSLVPFAAGIDPTIISTDNISPIWLTVDYPESSSSTGQISICIDDDGDGGTIPDPLGGENYDRTFDLDELEMIKIFDPDDNDQSGTRIWVCDGSDALIVAAYGQDPVLAGTATPDNELDFGMSLSNTIPFSASKCVTLINDYNSNGKFDECDEVQYSISLKNVGTLTLSAGSITIFDTLDAGLEYLNNSTNVLSPSGITPVPDETATSTAFPVDEDGYQINDLIPPGDSVVLVFDAAIAQTNTSLFIKNVAHVTNVSLELSPETSFPVENPTAPDIPLIPVDTILNCDAAIPNPPFQDTCLYEVYLRQSSWTVNTISSEEVAFPGADALDGDPDSYWFSDSTATYPHEIVIDLGQVHLNLFSMELVPIQNSTSAHIADYAIDYWDGAAWVALTTGTWSSGYSTETASFANVNAQFIRLQALSSANGTNYAGAAEINFIKCAAQLTYVETSTQVVDGSEDEYNYDIERTWTITDNCGNTGDQVQTITVQDTTPPQLLNVPADVTVDAGDEPALPTITISDNCDNPLIATYTADTVYVGCTSTITRRWTSTDASTNVKVDSQVITVNGGYTLSLSKTDNLCFEGSAGSASVTPEGGQSPFTYSWSNGASTPTASSLTEGWNYVTVSDANSCLSIDSIQLIDPTELTVVASLQTAVSCNSGSNGSVVATPSGGTGTATYLWNTGATTPSITGLTAGTYAVTVTDQNSCQAIDTIILTEPTALNATMEMVSDFNAFGVSCNGGSDGIGAVIPSGGTAPYTFNWSNSATNDTIFNVAAGSYSVTLTDANSCSNIQSVTITTPSPLVANAGTDVSICQGDSTILVASQTGGVAPYTYVWNQGLGAGQVQTGIQPTDTTDYAVTITDANGCMAVDTVRVLIGSCAEDCSNGVDDDLDGLIDCLDPDCTYSTSAFVISNYTGRNISCAGASDGAATAVPLGGLAPHTYLWDTGSTNDTITALSARRYFVTITDANGCNALDSIDLVEPLALTGSASEALAIACVDGDNGAATASASGGTAPYAYLWSTGATTQTITDLVDDTYDVTITDFNGCSIQRSTTLSDPAAIIVNAGSDVSICIGTTVTLTASASGGAGGFTYAWDNGLGAGASHMVTPLDTTTYQVIAQDANGCQQLATVTITIQSCTEVCDNGYDDDLDGLTDCDDPDCQFATSTSILSGLECFGDTDAIGSVSPLGGVAPHTYLWNDATTNSTIINKGAGSYYVSVTDDIGCITLDTIVITQPTELMVSAGVDEFICLSDTVTITATVSGGTSGYTYAWDNGLGAGASHAVFPTDTTTYIVTVTDANGCTSIDSMRVVITACTEVCDNGIDDDLDGLTDCDDSDCAFDLVAEVAPDAITSCVGANDVSIKITPLSSAGPFAYVWEHGPSVDSIGDLGVGVYRVTVTNTYGCISIDSVEVTEPPVLTSSTSADQSICSESPIAINAFGGGGTPPYTYVWSHGLGSGQSFIVNPSATTTYVATVTDNNGCEKLDSVLITIIACAEDCTNGIDDDLDGLTDCEDPDCTYATAISVISDYNGAHISCKDASDGSATVSPISGVSPYTYVWNEGTLNDTITGVPAGWYYVTITDANGCSAVDSIDITEPVVLEVDAGADVSTCIGVSTALSGAPSGGTAPYTYVWDNGLGAGQGHLVSPMDTTQYFVTITDANGCQFIDSVRVLIISCSEDCTNGLDDDFDGLTDCEDDDCSYATTTSVISNYNGEDISCNGASDGSARVVPASGISPFIYVWSDGTLNDTLSGVVAGRYYVTITDDNGCIALDSIDITEPLAAVSETTHVIADVTCFGDADGSGRVVAADGTAPYTYLWSDGAGTTNDTIENLSGGTYYVTVTDANLCTSLDSIEIIEAPGALSETTFVISDVTCFGDADGSGRVVATDGTAPYTYLWSDGTATTNDTIENLSGGTYYVTVTDANLCTSLDSIEIIEAPGVLSETTFVIDDVTCFGDADGSGRVVATDGTAPYTYLWSDGANTTNDTIANLSGGTYYVTVTDANLCTSLDSTEIIEAPGVLSETTFVISDVTCFGDANGSGRVVAIDGTAPYTYLWSDGAGTTNDTIENLSGGTYYVTVTDANLCTSLDSIEIIEAPGVLSETTFVIDDVTCFGDADGSGRVVATDGTAPYTYLWSDGTATTNDTIENLSGGTYYVTVTDANLCTSLDSIEIIEAPGVLSETTFVIDDVTCFGDADGSGRVVATDGTAPYTYLWSDGANTTNDTIANLSGGTYYVTVTDANLCTSLDSIEIIEAPGVLSETTFVISDVTCFGDANGSGRVVATDGTAPYTYLWSDGTATTNDTIENLSGGTYYVTVTDANLCTSLDSIEIIEAPGVLSETTFVIDNVTCFGDADGSGRVVVANGTAPYTYLWSDGPGTTNDTIENLAGGTYYVTVTDANLCTSIDSIEIIEAPGALSETTFVISDVTCFGDANGSGRVVAADGTAPYTYLWSDGANTTNDTIANLSGGTYYVTVTDANLCTSLDSIEIIEAPGVLSETTFVISDVTCFGDANGSGRVVATDGTAPYTYLWSDGAGTTNDTIQNLAGGTYYVTVTDANLCTSLDSIEIIEAPGALSETTFVISDVTCFGDADGSGRVVATDGTAPYTYLWSDGTATTNDTIENLSGGTYYVTVTDANLCTSLDSIEIIEAPGVLSETTFVIDDVTCFGDANGSGRVVATDGTAPYTYLWSDGANTTNDTIANLSGGTYYVTVTDANLCTSLDSIEIIEAPGVLSETTFVISDVTCFGDADGSGRVVATDGTAPYTYQWSDGANTTNDTIANLSGGTYYVTVTDANLCITLDSISILEAPGVLSETTFVIDDVTCFGDADGSGRVVAADGTAPYTYLWSDGAGTTNDTIENLAGGTYYVTVTDANLCTSLDSIEIVEAPGALSETTFVISDVTCFGDANGSGRVVAADGTAPYTYLWSDGANTTNDTIANLSGGTYYVTVTDANLCTSLDSIEIIEAPGVLSETTFVISDVTCFGDADGSGRVVATDGTAPYTYQWSDGANTTNDTIANLSGGTYYVTVTDANLCITLDSISILEAPGVLSETTFVIDDVTCFGDSDGSGRVVVANGTAPYTYLWSDGPGTTNDTIENLAGGTYYVTVTDANLCTSLDSIEIIEAPGVLSETTFVIDDVTCFGDADGSGRVVAIDGTAPYTYLWSDGVATTNDTIENLSGGKYYVTVTDANLCTSLDSIEIIEAPGALSETTFVISDVTCFGDADGSGRVVATDGTAPYTYLWSDGAGTTNDTIENLGGGKYYVTVTDANLCTAIDSIEIVEAPGVLSETTFVIDNVTCFGDSDGSGRVVAADGTAPYTYLWSDGAGTTNNTIENLAGGTYYVTVTDANLCTSLDSIEIIEAPGALSETTFVISDVTCFGDADGSGRVVATDGTAPYTYLWSDGAATTNDTIENLAGGTYYVTVTDANLCTSLDSIEIIEASGALSETTFVISDVTCFGDADGSGRVVATNGTAPYTYLWSDGTSTTNDTIENIGGGTYYVTVTDANLCTSIDSIEIVEAPAALSQITEVIRDVSCFGDAVGSGRVVVTGGTGPYTYLWSDGSGTTNDTILDLAVGTYYITVTDANLCVSLDSIEIAQPTAALSSTTSVDQNVSCAGASDGSGSVIASNGTGPYTYLWTGGATNDSIQNIAGGTYYVTVTDGNGCAVLDSITVLEPEDGLNVTDVDLPVTCYGAADGEIDITVIGGTSPYTYVWSNGESTQDLSNLGPGFYAVTVTDTNNCTIVDIVEITSPDAIEITSTQVNVACNGNSTGSIDISVSGGAGSYVYLWDDIDASTSANLSGLAADVYNLTVTDNTACIQTYSVTITESSTLEGSVSDDEDICRGDTATITVSGTGGTGPYTYQWDNGLSDTTSHDVSPLNTTTYNVTINDASGCTIEQSVTINVIPCIEDCTNGIDDDLDGLTDCADDDCSFTVSINVNTPYNGEAISCNGLSDASLSTTITNGGVAPFSYLWEDGEITSGLTGISAGNYSVTVTDFNGCSGQQSITVTEPDALNVIDIDLPISCSGAADGEIDISVIGGTGSYSYVWSNGATSEDISNLGPGFYAITVTDANGCARTDLIEITSPDAIDITSTQVNVDCNGNNTGSIVVSVSGGIGPYVYLWDDADASTTANISALPADVYNLTVTDNTACIQTYSVTITGSSTLEGSVSDDEDICRGDTATITVVGSGGTGPYTYAWDNGLSATTSHDVSPLNTTTYNVTITDASGCTIEQSITINVIPCIEDCTNGIDDDLDGLTDCADDDCTFIVSIDVDKGISCNGGTDGALSTSIVGGQAPYTYVWNSGHNVASISGLSESNYMVTVTDFNGCSASESVTLSEPTSINILDNAIPVSCFGSGDGEITLTVQGGVAPYTYDWNNDGLGDQDDTKDLNNLSGGFYLVEVRDSMGCVAMHQVEIVEPGEVNVVFDLTLPTCFGNDDASIDAIISNGIAPFLYQWSHDGTANTQEIDSIPAGTYSLTLTDNAGCTSIHSVTVPETQTIVSNQSPSVATCDEVADLRIGLSPAGGSQPYDYLWSTGAITDSIDVSATISAYYAFTITDASGCMIVDSISVETMFCNDPATISISGSNTICGGDSTYLFFSITDIDGAGPYDIVYSDGSNQYVLSNHIIGDSLLVQPTVETTYTIISITDDYGLAGNIGTATALIQLLADTDGDGVCDLDDICDQGDDNIDTDMNGIPDACEPCAGSIPDAPVAFMDSIGTCAGDLTPPFLVTVPGTVQVDWYDAPTDGNLISANRTLYIPPGPIVVYAEARDTATGCVSMSRTRLEYYILSRPVIDSLEVVCSLDSSFYTIEFYADEDNLISDHGTIVPLGGDRYMIDSIFTSDDIAIIADGDNGCDSRIDVSEPSCRQFCITMATDTIRALSSSVNQSVVVCMPYAYDNIGNLEMSIDGVDYDAYSLCIPDTGSVSTGLRVTQPVGIHGIAITDILTGCTDSIILIVNHIERDTIRILTYKGDAGSECIENVDILNPATINTLACEAESSVSTIFTWDDVQRCMSYDVLEVGIDTICISSVLPGGNVISTTIIVESIELTNDVINISLPIDTSNTTITTVCLDSTELIGSIELIEIGCESDNPDLTYSLIDSLACISFSASSELTDTLCAIICDDLGGCDTTYIYIDTYSSNSAQDPVAKDDSIRTKMNTFLDIEILANDDLYGNLEEVSLQLLPNNGTVTINADMTMHYVPTEGTCGIMDSFMYSIRTEHGEDQAMVYVNISCDSLIIFNGFSPNGDGINDGFTIQGIEAFEDNEVNIFNRWGNQIFARKNYSNDNQWTGDWNGNLLPDGTYFYVIYDSNQTALASGYVYIIR